MNPTAVELNEDVLAGKLDALADGVRPLINKLGIDAMVGAPDYIIARYMVSSIVTLGCTLEDIHTHANGSSNG